MPHHPPTIFIGTEPIPLIDLPLKPAWAEAGVSLEGQRRGAKKP